MPRPLHPKREEIINRRLAGESYGVIAQKLDLSIGSVSGICTRAGLGKVKAQKRLPRRASLEARRTVAPDTVGWDQCAECGRLIRRGKMLCGPCGWARHMKRARAERRNSANA